MCRNRWPWTTSNCQNAYAVTSNQKVICYGRYVRLVLGLLKKLHVLVLQTRLPVLYCAKILPVFCFNPANVNCRGNMVNIFWRGEPLRLAVLRASWEVDGSDTCYIFTQRCLYHMNARLSKLCLSVCLFVTRVFPRTVCETLPLSIVCDYLWSWTFSLIYLQSQHDNSSMHVIFLFAVLRNSHYR